MNTLTESRAPAPEISILGALMEWAKRCLAHVGGVSQLFCRSVIRIPQHPLRLRHWFEQMEQVGVNSLTVALLTASFTGMVIVLQTGVQLARFQSENMTPGIAGIALLREIAPVLTSLAVAARVGAGICAEIGTMKVTEQLDALESMGTDTLQYLVVPRLVAAMLMVPALTILADLVGILGGCLVGVTQLGLTYDTYMQITFQWVDLQDFVSGFLKTVVFGAIVATIGCYLGFNSEGGAEGVGVATTRAVVTSFILILVSDYFLTALLLKAL